MKPWIPAVATAFLLSACANAPQDAHSGPPPQATPIDEASAEDIDARIDGIIAEIEQATADLNTTFDGFYDSPDLEQVQGLIDEVERLSGLVGVSHNQLLGLDPDLTFRLQVLYSKGEFFQFLSEDLGAIPLPTDAPEDALVAAEERLALLMFDFDQLALDTFYEIDQLASDNNASDQVVELARSAIPNLEQRLAAITAATEEDTDADGDATAAEEGDATEEEEPLGDPGDDDSWFEAAPEEGDPAATSEEPGEEGGGETWFD